MWLLVEEGHGKPPLLIGTSQVYDGTSEMTMPSWTCLRVENSSSSMLLIQYDLIAVVGVIARHPSFVPYIRAQLTSQAVHNYMSHVFETDVNSNATDDNVIRF